MIPTVGTVAAFLILVAPGLIWQRLRERQRPALRETAFREAGNIALASVLFHVAALLAVLPALWVSDISLADWVRGGSRYFADRITNLGWAVVAEPVVACFLAAFLAILTAPSGPRLYRGPLWFRAFRLEAPQDTSPFAQVILEGGTEFWGLVGNYTAEDVPMDERELELAAPISMRMPGETQQRLLPQELVSRVVLPGGAIRSIMVGYLQPGIID